MTFGGSEIQKTTGMRYIRNKDPFFLMVGCTRPHFPNEAASAMTNNYYEW